ncbi:MAG: ABC transporter ATP-binding protein [Acidobacteria bacterium]|nr:ABC transporter ATP-binding protein [Acidobacteriota bacterium]
MSNATLSTSAVSAARSAAPAELRLCVEQASYAYSAGDRVAPLFTLEATSLSARRQELVAIVGPNASGKSTLLRLISGALRPLSGRVQLDGFEVGALNPRTRARRIAVVQQESPLLFPVRVDEYVLQGRHPYGQALHFETAEDLTIAEQSLAQVGAAHLRGRWMHQISGGEKQKVVLARALAQQPLLLLLDEPTLHLDIGAQVELLQQLRSLAQSHGYTIVVVTHELNLAAEFADQVALLHRGKCLRSGTPAEVYRRELLEQVFGASLEVETRPSGRPHVTPLARREDLSL